MLEDFDHSCEASSMILKYHPKLNELDAVIPL